MWHGAHRCTVADLELVRGEFEAELAGKVLWAFPPTALIGQVLETLAAAAAISSSTRATVVVPHWPQQP